MTYRQDVVVCDVHEAVKAQESLAPFHTCDAIFANGLVRNAYEAVLTHEGTIVVGRETLRAGVNLVASDVGRHAFNRYHVQLMTSLIIQRKTGELRSVTS